MYNLKNTLRHGLLFASLVLVPAVGFGISAGGSGADLDGSLSSGNYIESATAVKPDTASQESISQSYFSTTYSENGTSGQTGLSLNGSMAYIYYGYPYRNAPNYNYYPYRPYYYHYYYYPYRPYYYRYGW